MDPQPEGSTVSVLATKVRVVVQPPKIEVYQQAHAESFAAGEVEPRFRALLKERFKYLFMIWGCTLVTLAYMRARSVGPGYEKLHVIAVCLVACSGCIWLILYCFFERVGHRLRMVFVYSCNAAAVIALGIALLKLIYL